ncbi:hypothetical protein Tcan_05518 [Toxocara canis]|uniref:Uncharacterized protein n=1 Tax=Toxocara canis TaxID=6265 RepID=A0A0B2V9Y9_TOXCA|nr:hypothetical protein Tcan_05518 [Toxocara canis]
MPETENNGSSAVRKYFAGRVSKHLLPSWSNDFTKADLLAFVFPRAIFCTGRSDAALWAEHWKRRMKTNEP